MPMQCYHHQITSHGLNAYSVHSAANTSPNTLWLSLAVLWYMWDRYLKKLHTESCKTKLNWTELGKRQILSQLTNLTEPDPFSLINE